MRRNTLILLAVIAVLGGILAIQRIDFGPQAPSIAKWDGEPDKVVIRKPATPAKSATSETSGESERSQGEKLLLRQKDGKWRVSSKDYPADTAKVQRMLNRLEEIGRLEVVSTRADEYDRYELNEEKALKVSVFEGDSLLRELYLGKSSSVARKTYARQPGKERVFLVDRRMKRAFDTSVSALRDKTIVEIDRDALQRIEINSQLGPSVTLRPAESEQEKSGETGEQGKGEQDREEQKLLWRVEGAGQDVSQERITAFFRTVSPLSANSFNTGTPEKEQLCTFTFVLKEGSEKTVTVYRGGKPGTYPAVASTSPYPFLLSAGDLEAMLLEIEKLMPESLRNEGASGSNGPAIQTQAQTPAQTP